MRAKAHCNNNVSERLRQAEETLDAGYRRNSGTMTAFRLIASQPYPEPVASLLDATAFAVIRSAAAVLEGDGHTALAGELRKLLREA